VKKRIAIWIHGGIGTGPFSQGVPMLQNIVNGLSEHFEIVVYSQSRANDDFKSDTFEFRSASPSVRNAWLRWCYLVRYFIKDYRKKNFDIALAFWGYPAGVFAVLLSKFFPVRSVIYFQGGDAAAVPEINYGVFQKFLPRTIARWAYENASMLITMSNYQRDQLKRFQIKNNIQVIPWGVDPNQFPFLRKNRNGELKVIHVGHYAPVKDQATVLRTFVSISKKYPAKLKLFGADGGSKNFLQRLSTELGISHLLEFNDVAPYAKMSEHYRWADVMIHTSFSEGQCMALTEAAASGVLMAGTNIAPLYDLGERAGVIANTGDFQTLSDKVLELLTDEKRWNEKIEYARVWCEAHPLSWTINEIKNRLTAL
jgi:glycosyltransferase involved in cell wall biosynthesis